uniref:Uncharacterized protein n=1 Tax=Pyrodinium bahamense TaxID=73915 RepID=A0A7R9ZVW3_9DINO
MEALCGLFDAVACVGELLGRGGEKEEELETLVGTVESVSQSVRTFAADLDASERDAVFNSNQVFPQLAKHLRQCDEVISKYRRTSSISQQQLEDHGDSKPMLSSLKRGLLKSTRTFNEGLEVLSGKLGSFGAGLLRLPEDELAIIRQSSLELARLVPQLNLAISVFTLRGQKRLASPAWTNQLPLKVSRLEAPAPGGDAAAGLSASDEAAKEAAPLLRLQLVSDHAASRTCTLPALTTQELRPISSASSSSVDSAIGTAAEGTARLVFGRQELKDKIPKSFTLSASNGQAPQPVSRYISRDMFVLDIQRDPPKPEQQDTMDFPTLQFGAPEDFGPTLALGSDTTTGPTTQIDSAVGPSLATVSGLSANGLHLRKAGQTVWRWASKEQREELRHGDRIALLLESPPGSCVPGPPRDLGAEEAQCLMGLELQRP